MASFNPIYLLCFPSHLCTSVSLKTCLEALMGFQGCSAGMRWSGHFQVQTQRGGGFSWSSHIQVCTYLVIQVGPCFTTGHYPSEEASSAARMLQQKYFWFSHSETTNTMKPSLLKKCSSKEQQLVFLKMTTYFNLQS